jgi:hypothetical protein
MTFCEGKFILYSDLQWGFWEETKTKSEHFKRLVMQFFGEEQIF